MNTPAASTTMVGGIIVGDPLRPPRVGESELLAKANCSVSQIIG
jgi:hypothetical protein